MSKYEEFRPNGFDGFVGQKQLIRRLETHIQAALAEVRPLEHLLLTGPPGFGKTTLARLVADKLSDPLLELVMPVTEKAMQASVQRHQGVLLLDEIHGASKKMQESLLTLIAPDGYLQTKTGMRIEAQWLTVVAATTEPEKIIPPLYDRFRIKPVFEDYTAEEMAEIVLNMAIMASLPITEDDAIALGKATGGTPRNAAELITGGRALSHELSRTPTAEEILEFCQIDEDGLNRRHMAYLQALARFGGQRGVKQIATVLRLSESFCLELERLMFSKDLITYGAGGRELTQGGYAKVRNQEGRSATRTRSHEG